MKYFYDTEFLEGTQKKRFLGVPIGDTKPTIDLISIGIVSEDNREYYAISKEFNFDEAWNIFDLKANKSFPDGPLNIKEYWIRKNVLIPIFFELAMREFHDIHFKDEWCYNGEEVTLNVFKSNPAWANNKKWFKRLLNKYGKTNKQIADDIKFFISRQEFLESRKPKDLNDYENCIEWVKNNEDLPELYGYYSAYDHVVFCWLFGLMKDLPKGFPMYTRDLKHILDDKAYDIGNRICYESGNHTSLSIEEVVEDIKKSDLWPKQENEHNALADARWNLDFYNFLNTLK